MVMLLVTELTSGIRRDKPSRLAPSALSRDSWAEELAAAPDIAVAQRCPKHMERFHFQTLHASTWVALALWSKATGILQARPSSQRQHVKPDVMPDWCNIWCNGVEEVNVHPKISANQVLVVEARDLKPVHGIGTNPYVLGTQWQRSSLSADEFMRRGRLGEHVRRSPTVWSNLRPAWHYVMEFPVVSTRGRKLMPFHDTTW